MGATNHNLSFQTLRARWGCDGRPMAASTAREHARRIPFYKIGRNCFWTLPDVQAYERTRRVMPVNGPLAVMAAE